MREFDKFLGFNCHTNETESDLRILKVPTFLAANYLLKLMGTVE